MEEKFNFQTNNPKEFMYHVIQVSGMTSQLIDSVWGTVTLAESRWAVEQLYKANKKDKQSISGRFKKIIRESTFDVKVDTGLLEMMISWFNDDQLSDLAKTVQCNAHSLTNITNPLASYLRGTRAPYAGFLTRLKRSQHWNSGH